ncbi:MAG: aminotransferase class V-fold PLP-dependent enzyme [Myxococcota bacterium]
METCFVNLVEAGDPVVVGVHGVFGQRMAEVARRAGARVVTVEAPWGTALDPEAVRAAAKSHGAKLIAVVHAETSTGVLLDLAPFRAIADEVGALLLVDAVTSLGGVSIGVDRLRIDAIYSGSQKCLSCPPGLAPISFSPAAEAALVARKSPVQSWYLDLSLIRQYWGEQRVYHHTAPINMLYGLHEALRLVMVEGLAARAERHRQVARLLWSGLAALGFELLVPEADRLPPLTTVRVPDGVDEAAVRRDMLERFGVEIGGGLGPLKGKVWRIGLMGHGATPQNVAWCLAALGAATRRG